MNDLPAPPKHLDKLARQKWREVAAIILQNGQWTPAVADAAAAYAVTWSRWAAAESEVGKLGAVIKSPSGFPIQNPYLSIAVKAQADLRRWAKILAVLENDQ
ncbi:MAG: P27 family phage terminase small subunit [Planctomycetales bacterium]|nr:P27 family phage terminase small subunit [Planctomycetales bacterium]